MKDYKQIIPLYLKAQFKRTVSVAIAIVIAVTLVICILTLDNSYNINSISAAQYWGGRQHATFFGLNHKNVEELRKNKKIKELFIGEELGYGRLKNGTGIYLEGRDKRTLNFCDYRLLKGRLPGNSKEIVIEKWMLDNLKLDTKCGQNLTFDIITDRYNGNRYEKYKAKAVFKLVGILKDNVHSKATNRRGPAITVCETSRQLFPVSFQKYFALVSLKNYHNIQENLVKIEKQLNNNYVSVSSNGDLISQCELIGNKTGEGSWLKTFKKFLLSNFAMLIAMFMVIYNIFNISIMNRRFEFSIMKAVGAKPAQIRKLIFGEALVISSFAIPLGILTGIGISKAMTVIIAKGMNGGAEAGDKLYIPTASCALGVVMILIAVFLAIILPAYKAGSSSPMEALRGDTGYIKNSKTSVGFFYNIFMHKFGISFNLALQNMWRNKSRIILTILCMSICGVLYLGRTNEQHSVDIFNSNMERQAKYYDAFLNENDCTLSSGNYSFFTVRNGYSIDDLNSISRMKGIKEFISERLEWNAGLVTDRVRYKKEYSRFIKCHPEAKDYLSDKHINVSVVGIENKYLRRCKRFLVSGAINEKTGNKLPTVFVRNKMYIYKADGKEKVIQLTDYKAGDIIKLELPYIENNNIKQRIYKCKIGAILNEKCDIGKYGAPVVIMDSEMMRRLTNSSLYQEMKVKLKSGMAREKVKRIEAKLKSIGLSIKQGSFLSVNEENEKAESLCKKTTIVEKSILLSLVLIAIVNIYNTVTTNLHIRKREFGMLKIVGITKRQLINMIFIEIMLYVAVACFIAFCGGGLLCYINLKKYNVRGLQYVVSWSGLLISFLAYTVFSVLASIVPVKDVVKRSAIESMKIID